MLELQPDARAYLSKIKALATDNDDNDVFIGLTRKESVWYAKYVENSFNGTVDRSDASEERYLALQDRHEEARQSAIAEDPPPHAPEPSIQ